MIEGNIAHAPASPHARASGATDRVLTLAGFGEWLSVIIVAGFI